MSYIVQLVSGQFKHLPSILLTNLSSIYVFHSKQPTSNPCTFSTFSSNTHLWILTQSLWVTINNKEQAEEGGINKIENMKKSLR